MENSFQEGHRYKYQGKIYQCLSTTNQSTIMIPEKEGVFKNPPNMRGWIDLGKIPREQHAFHIKTPNVFK